jgi:hypothetical protein
MLSDSRYSELCEKIFGLSPNIRFAGVITKMGTIVAGGMHNDLQSMEDKNDSYKLYLQFALRNELRKDFDSVFGRAIYSIIEREKIKFASFPLADYNHILMISFEKKEKDHFRIIQNVLNIIHEYSRFG